MTLPYFIKTNKRLPDDLTAKLLAIVETLEYSNYDKNVNCFWYAKPEISLPPFKKVFENLLIKPAGPHSGVDGGPTILRFGPGEYLGIHLDDASKQWRRTVLSIPLSPDRMNYAGTDFYESETQTTPTATANYDGYPVFLNTDELHSMLNTDKNSYRYALQYGWYHPIEYFADKEIFNDDLFK